MTYSTDRDPYNQRLERIREQIEAGTITIAESIRLVPEWASRAALVFGDHPEKLTSLPATRTPATHLATAAGPAPATAEALACVDCQAPADVEALHLDTDDHLVTDTAACREHADPYLADATDVVWLESPATDSVAVSEVGDDLADDLGL